MFFIINLLFNYNQNYMKDYLALLSTYPCTYSQGAKGYCRQTLSSLASSKSKTSRFSTCSTGLRLLELLTEVYAHFTFSVNIGGTLVCPASLIYLRDSTSSLSLLGCSFGVELSCAAFRSSSQSLL